MSVPNNNVSVLNPTIPINQGIFEESTTQQARLGSKVAVGDRVFRYACAATNVTAGQIVQCPAPVASWQSAVASVAAATTGAKALVITASAAATNAFAEGYVCIASAALTGGGLMFRIKDHGAVTSAVAATFNLYDALPGAVGAGPVNVIPNMFNGVTPITDTNGQCAGVAPIAVTSGNYFWVQTWGIAPCLQSVANSGGATLIMGTGAGAVSAFPAGTTGTPIVGCIIGHNVSVISVATQVNPVFLTVMP